MALDLPVFAYLKVLNAHVKKDRRIEAVVLGDCVQVSSCSYGYAHAADIVWYTNEENSLNFSLSRFVPKR